MAPAGFNYEINLKLEKILKELAAIKALVTNIPQVQVEVSNRYLATINALRKLGGFGTATAVSKVTGHMRAYESENLNQLLRQGILTKEVGHYNGRHKNKIFRIKMEI